MNRPLQGRFPANLSAVSKVNGTPQWKVKWKLKWDVHGCAPLFTFQVCCSVVLQVQLKPVPVSGFLSVSLEQGEFILRGPHLCWKYVRDLFFGLVIEPLETSERFTVKLLLSTIMEIHSPYFFIVFLSEYQNFAIGLSTESIKFTVLFYMYVLYNFCTIHLLAFSVTI